MSRPTSGKASQRRLLEVQQVKLDSVYQGDCLEVMRSFPDETIGTIVTSPPYNIKNSTGNGLKSNNCGKWPNAALQNGYVEHDDSMPHSEYVKWQRECLNEMMRILKQDGVIFYNHKWRVQNGRIQDREEIVRGFPVRQIIIWQRDGGINFNPGYFLPTYEVIYMIAKPKFRLVPKANKIGDVWRLSQERNNEHPAPFPVQLAKNCIISTDNGTVLDPFLGSGTTAIAAKLQNRHWIGIEKSKAYCQLAKLRIEKASTIRTIKQKKIKIINWK